MATIPGVLSDPLRGFRFRVTLDLLPGTELGFKSVSGLGTEFDVFEIKEGHRPFNVHKIPQGIRTSNVKLERGLAPDLLISIWHRDVREAIEFGLRANSYQSDVSIELIDRDGTVGFEWRLLRAWPTKLTWSALDATSSKIVIQSMELAVDEIEFGPFNIP